MTFGELEELWRQQADDTVSPLLWNRHEFARHLNDAEVEACRRARLIVDSRTVNEYSVSGTTTTTTAGPCRITLGSGTDFYDLDTRVIYLRRVKLASRKLSLDAMDYRDMDSRAPGWEAHTGNVTGYVRGMDSGMFRPYKIPTAADTVNLMVVREPLAPMEDPDDTPEIAARYHLNLLDWVHYRAYSKKDSKAYDPDLAQKHLAVFEAEFGTQNKAAAFEEEWVRNNQPYDSEDGTF